ncbi:MAG TPA: ankyrin repeat domain-containing protein [Chthoniobacterales bacterium]|jgi:ankyrin repeat protein|nr:ankyrin repeat domain-containing protein [Chthoniobacterales bacterium]
MVKLSRVFWLLVFFAILRGHASAQYMIPSPLPQGPLTYHGPNGEVPIPPLFQAVIRKDAQRVGALLTQGADANEMCPCGTSPLEAAVSQVKDARIADLLLAYGADPNRRTPKNVKGSTNEWTPLFYAIYDRRAELVSLLLRYHAKTDLVDVQGKTPLQWARERKASDIVALLQRAGVKR